jgi:hypothetical protein
MPRLQLPNTLFFGATAVIVFGLTVVVACDRAYESPPEDVCNDRAYDECAHIAQQRCQLSGYASEKQLLRCKPFVQCEDAAFDDCMAELGR